MRWTTDEVNILKRGGSLDYLSQVLGRSVNAVQKKRRQLGITGYTGIFAPEYLSQEEKEARIYKLAMQYRIKIK